jgi:hypothetical protein
MLAAVTRNKSDTRCSDGYQSFNPSAELDGNAVRALNGPWCAVARRCRRLISKSLAGTIGRAALTLRAKAVASIDMPFRPSLRQVHVVENGR